MPVALEIAFGRRSQAEMQFARTAHAVERERIHQGRHLELMHTPKKACGFVRVWNWINTFGRKRPAMMVQSFPSASRSGTLAKENFARVARLLHLSKSQRSAHEAGYCKAFEKCYALSGSGEGDLSKKACLHIALKQALTAIQFHLDEETLDRLENVKGEIFASAQITEQDKGAAQFWMRNLPSPRAREVLSNFIAYEKKVRKQEVEGPSASQFDQLGIPPKKTALLHLQFDADLQRLLSDTFQKYHSRNPQGNIPGMVWQAYNDAMNALPEISDEYPKGYLETITNGMSQGISHTLKHNIGPGDDWSAPVESTMQKDFPTQATVENFKAIASAMEVLFPRSIEKCEEIIRNVTIDKIYPTEALEVFKFTYLTSFKERYGVISDSGKKPVSPRSLWIAHAKAQSWAAIEGVGAAFGATEIYSRDRDAFHRDLLVLCCDINVMLRNHQELGAFRNTMSFALFGFSAKRPDFATKKI